MSRGLRSWIAVFAAALAMLAAPAAWAQKDGDASSVAAIDVTPSHRAAARDTLQALMIDSGVASEGSLLAFTLLTPMMRQQITATPWYASLTPQHRSAVDAYFERVGRVGQEEAVRGAPQLLDEYAPRLAALFSEGELADIAAFVRTPEGGGPYLRSVLAEVRNEATQSNDEVVYSDAENAAAARFDLTAGGAAFHTRESEVTQLLGALAGGITGGQHITARFQRDLCAASGDQCPPDWRGR